MPNFKLRSMTGFGQNPQNGHLGQWEIRSVNGKCLEFKWRLPPFLRMCEKEFEKLAKNRASRGRVEISLRLDGNSSLLNKPALNFPLAESLLEELVKLAEKRGDNPAINYVELLKIPELWSDRESSLDETTLETLCMGLSEALEDWNQSRELEGKALCEDLFSRISKMEGWLDELKERAPYVHALRLSALRERLCEALAGTALDEGRFLQETVIAADKADVSEELTRLGIHLSRLRELLFSPGDAGRKIDFTLQECFREINTCGNKLLDSQASRMVVNFKNELEKCREQAMNLE